MFEKKYLICLLVAMCLICGCRTVDPVKQSDSFFPVFLAKRYAKLYYTMKSPESFEEIVKLLDPETSENFDKSKLNDIMRGRSGSIVSKDEEFVVEILQEISFHPEFRFVYLLKKEDFGFFGSSYKSLRIDRVICVERESQWFIYGVEGEDFSKMGIDTVHQIDVSELKEKEDQAVYFKGIIEEDFERTKLSILTKENPGIARDEIVDELVDKGVQLYDSEKYREALRLFQKALSISDGQSQKASTYLKRCQKAVELGL